ncbi:hypothetical protein [Streptomyces sp. NPDC058247]|uniref:hypothetical protein n=1 Tax=Streptomyces sp. NPDC058247 TaxID=3346401 RepID=UPI0036E77A82
MPVTTLVAAGTNACQGSALTWEQQERGCGAAAGRMGARPPPRWNAGIPAPLVGLGREVRLEEGGGLLDRAVYVLGHVVEVPVRAALDDHEFLGLRTHPQLTG